MLKKFTNKKGFTLMEMLIVVAIIAVLVAIAIPTFTSSLNKAKAGVDLANIRSGYANAQIIAMTEGSEADGTYGLKKDGTVTAKNYTGDYTTQGESKYVTAGTSIAGQFAVGTGTNDVSWGKGKNITYTVENGRVKEIKAST